MTKKSLIQKSSLVLGLAAFAVNGNAAPAISLGEEVDLFLLASAGITYESNLFADSTNEVDDFRLNMSPGIELALGRSPAANAKLVYRHHFHIYDDRSELEADFADLDFRAVYDSGIFVGNLVATFRERASNDVDTTDANLPGRLIRRDEANVSATGRYQFTELIAFSAGLEFNEFRFREPNLTSHEAWSVPVTFFYRVRPALDMTAGYRYRKVNVSGLFPDARDNFFFIGAQGELGSPLFIGNASIGYQERSLRGVNEKFDSVFYNFMVTYLASARVSHFLSIGRDFRTSSNQGTTFTHASVTFGSRARLTNRLSANVSLTYAEAKYQRSLREEEHVFFNVGMTYRPNDYLSLNANYGYVNVDGLGTPAASDYTRNRISVSASVRY